MKVHVYRNKPDDIRLRSEMHFCSACGGWYGVPHDLNHCRQGKSPSNVRQQCACRPCRESTSKPIEGDYGFFTQAKAWQP